jgi:hypothetical protein
MFKFKNLGLSTPEGRMNKDKFQSLQRNWSKRIMSWGNSMSTGGKEASSKTFGGVLERG